MTTTKRISISATPREKVTVELVGKDYVLTTPKSSIALAFAQKANDNPNALLDEMQVWIVAAFGAKNAEKIAARLTDPTDDLDINHISDLMVQLTEASTPNPSS